MSFLYPLSCADDAKPLVDALRERYYDARHHCFAYRIGQNGDTFRVVDDGEPSGTAGRPILGALTSRQITNTLAVVVRYFGGTKLGTSGLINAYKEATLDALNNAQIIEKTIDTRIYFTFGYSQMNEVMRLIKSFTPRIISQTLENSCSLEMEIRQREAAEFTERAAKIEGLTIEIR